MSTPKNRSYKNQNQLAGFTLLEMVVSTAMLSMLVVSVTVMLRSSQEVWQAYDSDHSKIHAAHATLRHLTRKLRQAETITAISTSSDDSGSITITLPDGKTYVWDHSGTEVRFGENTATHLLSGNITKLKFIGYENDTTTETTTGSDVQSIKCFVTIQLNREVGAEKTISCWVWRRAWKRVSILGKESRVKQISRVSQRK